MLSPHPLGQVRRALPCSSAFHAVALRGVRDRAPARILRPGQAVALVNVDFGPGTVLGISLIGAGILLYQARSLKNSIITIAPYLRALTGGCRRTRPVEANSVRLHLPPVSRRQKQRQASHLTPCPRPCPSRPQVRTVRPEISRDYDVFFSSVGLLCGGILVFQARALPSHAVLLSSPACGGRNPRQRAEATCVTPAGCALRAGVAPRPAAILRTAPHCVLSPCVCGAFLPPFRQNSSLAPPEPRGV